MPKFNVCVEWVVYGDVEIEADSLEAAADVVEGLPLEEIPAEYLEGSFKINYDFSGRVE